MVWAQMTPLGASNLHLLRMLLRPPCGYATSSLVSYTRWRSCDTSKAQGALCLTTVGSGPQTRATPIHVRYSYTYLDSCCTQVTSHKTSHPRPRHLTRRARSESATQDAHGPPLTNQHTTALGSIRISKAEQITLAAIAMLPTSYMLTCDSVKCALARYLPTSNDGTHVNHGRGMASRHVHRDTWPSICAQDVCACGRLLSP